MNGFREKASRTNGRTDVRTDVRTDATPMVSNDYRRETKNWYTGDNNENLKQKIFKKIDNF